ncbi:MAG: asparagine synthase (glutamine-hydrolyzing), partial [Elusimicrobia bacterium]|nr:asparagine synthase (glutamine-hydrolyzing) [Elusimicrobiota bacterium]
VWLSFNGTVTQSLKRREELARSRPFRSSSDTEVLLRLYEETGIDFIPTLSGMFAFCLYDRRRRKAFLVRDPHGMRPVFFTRKRGRLYFASEIKALLEVPGLEKRLDREALWHFLSLAYMPGRRTPYEEIEELQAGHLLEVDLAAGRVDMRRYHRTVYAPDQSLREADAAGTLHGLLRESVRGNLISDAPVGLTLSGGFDTSTLLALVKELGVSRDMHTFSLKVNEASFDESRYQRIMVDFARPIHHEIPVDPAEVTANIESTVAYLDEPSGNGGAVPMFLLAREAKKHVSVLLSGEGGDEIFNAYETHRAFKVRALYRRLTTPSLRRLIRSTAAALPTSYDKLSFDFLSKRFTEGAELDVPESHFHWRHALSEDEKRRLLPESWHFPPTARLFTELFHGLDFADDLDKISLIDLEYYFVDDLMVKNDRMIMAHSVETRFPFMEKAVVDFAIRIPNRFKVKGFQGRCIQKLAMKGSVPEAIARRSNMGLEMPHSLWFLKEFRGLADRYFSRKNVEKSGILNYDAVSELWSEHLSGVKDNGRPLWCVLNFLIWFDLFIYEGSYKRFLTAAETRPVDAAARFPAFGGVRHARN